MSNTSMIEITAEQEERVGKIISAVRKAVRAAVREHKLLGNSIAIWRDGKVVVIPPEEIEI